jgi:peptidoglycan hydrolase-like protein with peptidoglycan-binding domain
MRYSDFKMVEAADPDANDPRGRDQRDDPNAPVDAGLKAGPPYPQDQVVAVKALQTRLEKLGYSVGSTGIDGKYGPRTARAVAAFKKDNNITATAGSTVTPQELTVLKTAKSVKSPTPTGNEGAGGGSSSYDLPPLSDRDDIRGAVNAVLELIRRVEARGHYDIRNGSSRNPAILSMTVAEVQQHQRTWRSWPGSASAAIGAYQYTQDTLTSYIKKMGVNANTQKFDPAFQDRLAIFDMRDRSKLDSWLNGSISDEKFVNELSQVWAAIPNDTNQSAYRGVANNRKGINYTAAVNIVRTIRTGIA